MKLIDYAKNDRAKLIALTTDYRTQAEHLASKVIRLQEATERAINWLDLGAPSRAREALLEATRQ